LCKTKVCCCVRNNLQRLHILKYMNQFHTIKYYFFNFNFNIIIQSKLKVFQVVYLWIGRRNIVLSSPPFRVTCPTQVIIVDRIILMIFSGESISRKYSSAPSSQNYSSVIYLLRQSFNSSLYRFKTNTNETNITHFMQMFFKFNLNFFVCVQKCGIPLE
jgi:hypothetical protein